METCKYADWTRGLVVLLINIIGEENARNLLAGAVSLKFGANTEEIHYEVRDQCSDWTGGQVEALINLIGELEARHIINGRSFEIVNFEGALFDKNGRRIPKNLEFHVLDPRELVKLPGEFYERENWYKEISENYYEAAINEFNMPLGERIEIDGAEFKAETERLVLLIKNDSRISKMLNGAWLPIILPKFSGTVESELNLYSTTAKYAYVRYCVGKSKSNFCGKINILPKSRYEELIAKIQIKDRVGIYFLNPLQGYSQLASCEQMETLPNGLFLSGFEPLIAATMYPKLISGLGTYLDFGAFFWDLDKSGNFKTPYSLRSKDAGLCFWSSFSLSHGNSNSSCGLTFMD